MTAGIKLSNLHLRDGDGNWCSLDNAYVGDMLGEAVDSITLKQALNNIGGGPGIDTSKFAFKKSTGNNSSLELYYGPKNNDGTPTADAIKIANIPINEIDSNTTYSLTKSAESDGEYLIFTSSNDPNPVRIKLPEGGGGSNCSFEADSGVGYFSEVSSGSGSSGGGGNYSGDGETITITDGVIKLRSVGNIPVTRPSSPLSLGTTFSAVSAVNTDSYGRISSIVLTNYRMPTVEEIIQDSNFESILNAAIDARINKILKVS